MAADTSPSHCKSCQSDKQKNFTGEIAIHFPGLKGLEKGIVWVFPEVSVCLDCGACEFQIPTKELEVLRTGTPIPGAAVWLGEENYGGDAGNGGESEL